MEQSPLVGNRDDRFPFRVFLAYIIPYMGQAIYNCFGTLFLNDHGMTQTQIGTFGAVGTILLIFAQPIMGIMSDKSKSKGRFVAIVLFGMALALVANYLSFTVMWLGICSILISLFFMPSTTLQDNYTIELLEHSKWDFGNIRLGGTLGYATCAFLIGFIIKDNYDNIFWMSAIFFVLGGVLMLTLPKVEGHRQKKEKVKYSLIFRHRPLMIFFIFNVIYNLAGSFGRYYNIYFTTDLGGTNQLVGIMTTISALSEIPFFWYAGRIQKKLGTRKFILIAASATALKSLLLFLVTSPYLALVVQLLQGVGFASFNFCYMNFINKSVPRNMTATAQTVCSTISMIISAGFSIMIGAMSDTFGPGKILIFGAITMVIGIVFFEIAFPKAVKWQNEHPFPDEEHVIIDVDSI